jgi:hypothetical protein
VDAVRSLADEKLKEHRNCRCLASGWLAADQQLRTGHWRAVMSRALRRTPVLPDYLLVICGIAQDEPEWRAEAMATLRDMWRDGAVGHAALGSRGVVYLTEAEGRAASTEEAEA